MATEITKEMVFEGLLALSNLEFVNCQLFEIISKTNTDIQDILLELIFSYCIHHGVVVPLLDLAIRKEIESTGKVVRLLTDLQNTEHKETLFREDSLRVKLLMRFMFYNENRDYLCKCLPALIEELSQSYGPLNDNLTPITSFVEKYISTAEYCPSALRRFLLLVDKNVGNKFGNAFDAPISLDFIMFKFICPMLISPKKYDLLPEDAKISETTLIAASKLLNDIARNNCSNPLFGQFVSDNHTKLKIFLKNISEIKEQSDAIASDDKSREISRKQLDIFMDTVFVPAVEVTAKESEIALIKNPSISHLSSFHKKMLLATWDTLKDKKNKLGTIFYERLFEVAPSVIPLFRYSTSMNEKLIKILDYVLQLVKEESFSLIKKSLWMLGKRHNAYGAIDAHFVVVKQVFLWALEQPEMLGSAFTGLIKQSWDTAFNIVAHNMLRGMREGASEMEYKEEKKCIIQ